MHSLFWLSLIVCQGCVATIGVYAFFVRGFGCALFNSRGIKMEIKLELLRNYISDFIRLRIKDFEIDASQIADTTAIQALGEIQEVIKDDECSDFDAVEKIVCIFEKYNIDAGSRHDF